MRRAVILEAVRTPIGKRGGAFADVHPVALLAKTLQRLLALAAVDPALVEDHIAGCVGQVGEQSINVARNAWLAAGLPVTTPGVTVDRQCGSSQQAIHFAAEKIMAGTANLVVASGVESMSRIPMGSQAGENLFAPFGPVVEQGITIIPQGLSAEMVADHWGITRNECDAYAYRSHVLARDAFLNRRSSNQMVPGLLPKGHPLADEGVRLNADREAMAKLRPAFMTGGVVTAGNSSQISDGAAAVLVADEQWAKARGLKPRARITSLAVVGSDPTMMLSGVIPATQSVLKNKQCYLPLQAMDVVEINEAFASVVLAWKKEFGIADNWFEERVNPNGGAIAHGHPLGASGAILMTKLLHELERRDGQYGLQTMCEGGGMANATVIERI
jgi:acetyl-CoA C-acetyltransferase/acetyl-CoA acyltransferase